MLHITNKAIYNQFKGLVFLVSASPSTARGALLEETSALLGQHRERERRGEPTQIWQTVLSCYHGFPFPHQGVRPQWIPVLSTYGTRSSAAVLPPALLLCWLGGVVLQTKVVFCSVMLLCLSSYEVDFSIWKSVTSVQG